MEPTEICANFTKTLRQLNSSKHSDRFSPPSAVRYLGQYSDLADDLYQRLRAELNRLSSPNHKIACFDFLLLLYAESSGKPLRGSNKKGSDATDLKSSSSSSLNPSYHTWITRDFEQLFTKIIENANSAAAAPVKGKPGQQQPQITPEKFIDTLKRGLLNFQSNNHITETQYAKYCDLLESRKQLINDNLTATPGSKIIKPGAKSGSLTESTSRKRKQDEAKVAEGEDNDGDQGDENEKSSKPAASKASRKNSSTKKPRGEGSVKKGEDAENETNGRRRRSSNQQAVNQKTLPIDQDTQVILSQKSQKSASFSKKDGDDHTDGKNEEEEEDEKKQKEEPEMDENGEFRDEAYKRLTLDASSLRPEEFQRVMNDDRDRSKRYKEHIWEVDYVAFGKFIEFENLWDATPSSMLQHQDRERDHDSNHHLNNSGEQNGGGGGDDDGEDDNSVDKVPSAPRSDKANKRKVKPRAEVIKRNILTALDYERMIEENKISSRTISDEPNLYAK